MKNYKIKRKAFTLVEVLITVIIIGILIGLSALGWQSSTEKTKETACAANKKTLMAAFTASSHNTEEGALAAFLASDYKKFLDNPEAGCPSKGTYYVGKDEEGREKIFCDIHDKKADDSGSDSNVIPGTGGITATDSWKDAIKGPNTISFTKGQRFEVDGKFYVATSDITAWYDKDTHPGQSAWWTEMSSGGLVEVTGVSKDWNEIGNGDTFKRGDIILYNGSYYICNTGANDQFKVEKNEYYNNNPESATWAWHKL